MHIKPDEARDSLIHGLPPVLGVDDAFAALYMWLGARTCATHGTREARLYTAGHNA
jgi:hypothetical protein